MCKKIQIKKISIPNKKLLLSYFEYLRRSVFNQSAPVNPISESRTGTMIALISKCFSAENNLKKKNKGSLLDKMYFLVNFQNCQTRVVYWGNTGKYTPSRAGPILAFPVLSQLYTEYIFQYWPGIWLWRGCFENLQQGGLLMSPLSFLITRFYKSGQEFLQVPWVIKELCSTSPSRKPLGLSARMHSVRAIVMPYHTVTLHIKFGSLDIYIYISWSAQHFRSLILSARCIAIWQRKVDALSTEVHLIADNMA